MRIKCETNFKDQVDGLPVSFEKDDVCTVNDKDGARFLAYGWATDVSGVNPTSEPAKGSVDLDVHKGTLGQKTSP